MIQEKAADHEDFKADETESKFSENQQSPR